MALNNLGLGFVFTAKDLASGVMGKVRSSFNEVEGSSSAAAKSFGTAFKAFGVGAAIMGAGLAGFALLTPAVRASQEISEAIKLVATEADLAVFPMEKMREVSDKLALQFGSLPTEQAKALYKSVALGANDAAKSTAFLTGANLLAVAGNADLETSTQALGGALNAYGANFNEATAYSDAFFTAMKLGNTTVQDLAASVGRVTSSASNLGVSIDEILGAVSVMTNKGVAAAEAVSGLKEALANVVHPSADARAEAARLGIKFTQAELRAKGFQGFLKEITSSSKFTKESFSKLFTSVEGANAIMQVASGNLGDYNAVMEAMGKKAGATQAGFDIMADGLDFQEKKLAANKKILLATIGNAITPFVTTFMKGLNAIAEAFNRIPKPIVAFLTKIFLGISAVLTFVGAIISTTAAIALVIIGLKAVGVTIGGVLAIMLPAVVALGLLTIAFYGFKRAYEENLGGFRDFVDNTVAKVQLGFEALGQLFSQGGFSGKVRDSMNDAKNQGLKNFVVDVFVFVKRIQHLFEEIGTGFNTAMSKIDFGSMIQAFDRLGEALGFVTKGEGIDSAKSTWKSFGDVGVTIGNKLAIVLEFLIDVITDVVKVGQGMADKWDWISASASIAGSAFSEVGTKISDLLGQFGLMTKGTDSAGNGWRYLGMAISIVSSVIIDAIGAVGAVIGIVVSVVSGAVGIISSILSYLKDVFVGVYEVIAGIFTGNWERQWNGAKLIVFGFVDGCIGVLLELVGVVGGVVDSIAGMFGKDLGIQKGLQDFKNTLHNDMAKGLGITTLTGERATAASTASTLAPTTVAAPINNAASTPVNYGASFVGPTQAPQGIAALDAIAKNTAQAATVNATLVCDGEVLGKLASKVSKNSSGDSSGARNFTPAPTPT